MTGHSKTSMLYTEVHRIKVLQVNCFIATVCLLLLSGFNVTLLSSAKVGNEGLVHLGRS